MASPHLIELEEAASRIKQACDGRGPNQSSPFFFMVGAGISFPSVPLAAEIVSQCINTANKYNRSDEPKSKENIDVYSHWFEMAYGEPNQRQRYLRGLIEGKQITHANFRLAHLLLDNRISSIVVTTNFDDFLAKALTLFGKRHLVCDHPLTVGRINPTEPDLQIVHLHGTYWYYDCCNLRAELQDRALQSQQTTATMASLLDMILWDRSPLVLGYSGWEGDVFMDAFKRRLARPLGSNAYWFCFQRTQVESMPEWLKNNPNIRFVVPRERVARPAGSEAHQTKDIPAVGSEPGEQIKAKGVTSAEEDPSLPADRVLDKFIRLFDLKAPSLTRDPLGFLASQLDESLPKDEASDKDADIYAIKNVLERVRRAKERESAETGGTAESSETLFEVLRDALRRADYRTAIKLATQFQLVGLSLEHLNELSEAAWLAASKVYDNSQEEIAAYDLIVAISDWLVKRFPDAGAGKNEKVAKALFNKAVSLGAQNRNEEEIRVYDEVVRRYADAAEGQFRELAAEALVNKGITLSQLNRTDQEIAAYDELARRFGSAPEPEVREQVAKGLVNKGRTLSDLDRDEEAIATYDELKRRYVTAPESGLREQVGKGLFNKGVTLWDLNRSEEALAVYNEVIDRYADAHELSLREVMSHSLYNKGVTLGSMDRSEEALEAYDELIRRYAEAPEVELREQVAMALVGKGFRLKALNRSEEALSVYEEVIQRYGDASEFGLRVQAAKAVVNKGSSLRDLNRYEEAIAAYDEVAQRYGDSVEVLLREQVARALGNKGIILGRLNRGEEELRTYEEVVRRYGDAPEPGLRTIVTSVLNSIGFKWMIEAKALLQKHDDHSAQEKLNRALETLRVALERSADDPMILGNQAYAMFLLGQKDRSEQLLRRAISLGGEKTREAELKDAGINRLPQDDEFCEMVSAISVPSAESNS